MSAPPPSRFPESPSRITRAQDGGVPERGPWFVAVAMAGTVLLCAVLCIAAIAFRGSIQDLFDGDDDDVTTSTTGDTGTDGGSAGGGATGNLTTPTALPIPGSGGGGGTSVAPTGDMLFVSNRTGQWEIYRMNADGSGISQLTFGSPDINYSPEWSPDGTQIVFAAKRGGNWDIYLMEADGSNIRRLTIDPATDRVPAWSPDGTQIAFSSDRRGNFDVYVMQRDGTNQRAITTDVATDYYPDWSPDGQSLAYQSNRSGRLQIYRQHVAQDDSTALQLTSSPVNKGAPAWSPDGAQIAFYTNVGEVGGLDIYRVPANGGAEDPLVVTGNNEAVPSWSPEGSKLFFHQGNNGGTNIMMLDMVTGQVLAITVRSDRNWVPNIRREPGSVPAIVPTQIPPVIAPTSAPVVACSGTLPSRLHINERVRQRTAMQSFIHTQPTVASSTVGQVVPGLVMRVLEGPRCANGFTWWRVQYGRVSGWVIEISGGEYWLESVEWDVQTFVPPADRRTTPANASVLVEGVGLTNGMAMPPGEFQVEWYCNLQNFGVQADEHNWFCTDNSVHIFTLDVNDFDSICQATYYHPLAFAVQDGTGSRPAFRWQCYVYNNAPTPK